MGTEPRTEALTPEELASLVRDDEAMKWDGDTIETFGPDTTPRFRTYRRAAWQWEIDRHRLLVTLAEARSQLIEEAIAGVDRAREHADNERERQETAGFYDTASRFSAQVTAYENVLALLRGLRSPQPPSETDG